MGARIVKRRDLVDRGVNALKEAQKSLVAGYTKEAEIQVDIANAYARLAEALGESALSEYVTPRADW